MEKVLIHPRIGNLHPELTNKDVLDAWDKVIHSKTRLDKQPYECIAVGMDSTGRLVEMVAIRLASGDMLIFHAKTPPTKKTLRELEFLGGRRK